MNKKILLFLFLIILSLTLLKLFQYLTPPPSSVVYSDPIQSSTEVEVSLPIKFLFDRPLKADPEVTTNPLFEFTKSLDSGKITLLLIPQKKLSENTDYQVSLSGQNISPFILNFKTKSPPTPTPNPTPQPTGFLAPSESILRLLPIVTDKYTIEYFPNLKKFLVMILKNPYGENKKAVENWFKEQGIGDLTKFNIQYGSSRGVAP